MKRLERYQQKQFSKKILSYGALVIIIITILLYVGIPLAINASLFLSNLFGRGDAGLLRKEDVIRDFTITDIPTATNSARIRVSGSVTNFDEVNFYINGEKVKEARDLDSDEFSEEIGNLDKGENEVYLRFKAKKSREVRESEKYKVIYKEEALKLEIREPKDGEKTSRDEVIVSGQTDAGATIKINDQPIVVDSGGNFRSSVRLKEGENKISVKAQDDAGNIQEKTLTITFEKD